MAALRLAIAAVSLAAGAPAGADPVARWRPFVVEASARFGIPVAWIERVMRAESAGLTMLNGRPIRSSAGAMGLMQLMPGTWNTMRRRLGLGVNPDDPRDNILAGSFYLRLMHDRFGYPGLFAAYNVGPTGYASHLAGRRALPAETRAYLAKLSGRVGSSPGTGDAAPPSLFAMRRDGATVASAATISQPNAGLFVVRSDDR